MRVLAKFELDRVSGAGILAGGVLGDEAKVRIDTDKDSGGHIGWCRGLGNTARSNGGGGGLELPKHGDHVCGSPPWR